MARTWIGGGLVDAFDELRDGGKTGMAPADGPAADGRTTFDVAPAAGATADGQPVTPTPDAKAAERITVEISELLVSIYNSVDAVESKMFRRVRGLGVTMSEARIVQIVGDETFHTDRQISVSQIAAEAMVKIPSMTAGVNRLVDRGFLTKERDESDGRRVNVTLTRKGEEVYRLHTIFHMRMAAAIMEGMSLEDMEKFHAGIERLAAFYRAEEEK